ncbi:fatty-acid--CoA ligase [Campylobacter concisus]|uniref:fatty-acid--CoA ligase n=1 Tax=Campylobacter concisus TaxID=199 RepID=UPI000D649757|nr:fatty-acid--CoA ligase [Campylobacter concisus]
MLLKGLIVFFIFLLIVAICALIYLLLKNKDHQVLARGLEPESEEEEITIEKLEELAGDKTLSKNELFELIQIFGEKFIIPAKKNQVAPKEASNYINFIILICSHQNADAKLISFLDKEAKKKNPSYVAEIEDSERIGIENRKNRR